MRLSQYFLPTLREVPTEAEVISHVLMLRAGMIRKLAAGIYTLLPYGLAAVRKTKAIVREEMNRAGAIEVFMPAVQPAEIWRESGRWDYYGIELLRFKDRHGNDYCLGPTHEEVITDIIRRDIRSYRDMPVNLYQIQQKFRDEVRPRFGVMRGREFCMKDAYSFDVDDEASVMSYRKMHAAYCRIFDRLGLRYKVVEADSGAIGGSFSHEFMVLAATGEDAMVSCTACDYGANIEQAEVVWQGPSEAEEKPKPLKKFHTPGIHTIEELASFMGNRPQDLVKIVLFMTDVGPVAVFGRGDHEINAVKVKRFVGAETIELAGGEEVEVYCHAPAGSCGPVGIDSAVRLVADQALKNRTNWITGANEDEYHLSGAVPGRDFPVPEYTDARLIREGDACPRCRGKIEFLRGIEVGHIFRLGTKYSQAMGANYLDSKGNSRPIVMGCYGLGIERTVAAAIEQNHDSDGIIFPVPMAPFAALVLPVGEEEAVMAAAERLHQQLEELGVEVLLDDRQMRPGAKFKDADLIGVPYRLTVGRSLARGLVELKARAEAEAALISLDEAAAKTAGLIAAKIKL